MSEAKSEQKPRGNPTIQQKVTGKIEGALKPPHIKDHEQAKAIKDRILALQAESKAVSDVQLDIGIGEMISLFITRKSSSKVKRAHIRQAEIQAELAALRLKRGAGWRVLSIDIPNKTATIVCTSILAKYPLQDSDTAAATSFDVSHKRYRDGRYYSEASWPFSLARNWMNTYLLAAIPQNVRSHMRLVPVTSWSLGGNATSEDWLFLPSRSDLRLMRNGWGELDGRKEDFWLRDTGLGVGQSGQNVLQGRTDSYSSAEYNFGIQPMAVVDLTSFPAVVEILEESA